MTCRLTEEEEAEFGDLASTGEEGGGRWCMEEDDGMGFNWRVKVV